MQLPIAVLPAAERYESAVAGYGRIPSITIYVELAGNLSLKRGGEIELAVAGTEYEPVIRKEINIPRVVFWSKQLPGRIGRSCARTRIDFLNPQTVSSLHRPEECQPLAVLGDDRFHCILNH